MSVARGRGRGLGSRRVTRSVSRQVAPGVPGEVTESGESKVRSGEDKPPKNPWDYPNLSTAQRHHEKLQAANPEHDSSSCACCCSTCTGDDDKPKDESAVADVDDPGELS